MKKLIGILIILCVIQGTNVNAQSTHEKDSVLISRLNAKLNDWPNLARFREENNKLGLPSKNVKRVVFMGNSITQDGRNSGMFILQVNHTSTGV